MPELVEVAVPLPIFHTFTYAVPQELRDRTKAGCRVLVPFRNRRLVGVALGNVAKPPREAQLKSVVKVLDDEPVISPLLLKLSRWVAAYYFAPPGEAARVMLPPGLLLRDASGPGKERFWPVRRQLGVVTLADEPPRLTVRQTEAFDLLSQSRLPVLLSVFRQETGIGEGVLKAMALKKALRIEEVTVNRSPWGEFERLWKRTPVTRHSLGSQQKSALEAILSSIRQGGFQSLLLHGITGSGKTEVYLNAIQAILRQGRSALMMVPEIGLTPQVAHAFRGWFGEGVAVLHSALGEGERFDQWRRIRSGRCRVVLGTRSAVFAPLANLGIVVIDEEHDGSYKQDELPRYHTRETALRRARMEGAVVVMGSATPQLETYHLATEGGRHSYLALDSRVRERPLPTVHIVDMRAEFEKRGPEGVFSTLLEKSIRGRLARKEQVLVLINRRGYSPVLLCRSCGAGEECVHCSITLTYHRVRERLICHYCGYARSVPKECRNCGKQYIYFWGEGTEKIQELLREKFPDGVVDRLDRDAVTQKGAYDRILGRFSRGETDILVGTQMIAKGHDFPQVTLVGVLSADQALRLADFRAAERTFQLLTQVSGRAGRGDLTGDVIIQTFYPNHYSLKYACSQDYREFYRRESEYRRRFAYPPFTILANLLVQDPDRGKTLEIAEKVCSALARQRERLSSKGRMRILGPATAALERLRNEYRMQILVKAVSRRELYHVLKETVEELGSSKVNTRKVTIDVDPLTLL